MAESEPKPSRRVNPALLAFMNAAYERIKASFIASDLLSDNTKGTLRELGVRGALAESLPPIVRVHSGDIIDSEGRQSGQLDWIAVSQDSPSLGFGEHDPRIVLAEGVIAVLELKSNVAAQWDQVKRTYDKVKALRREPARLKTHQGLLQWNPAAPTESEDAALPFYALGAEGWADLSVLERNTKALRESFGAPHAPPVMVFQLEPPAIAWAASDSAATGLSPAGHFAFPHEDRGMVLANLWMNMSENARTVLHRPINLLHYLRKADS